jgi:dipeptidyl aminopeptidase/acylaminoacyl peptidase
METRPISSIQLTYNTTFNNETVDVHVDFFIGPDGLHPAIILLHGADGLDLRREPYERYARFLARRGYAVFLVHYFDGSGVTVADRPTMRERFPFWIQSIVTGIDFLTTQPNVIPNRLGVLGLSLGGSLALTLGATRTDISAVVEYFGAMPRVVEPGIKSMPPTLIIHGAKDNIVPVEEAYRLERILKSLESPYEMRVFADEGHFFSKETAMDAARLTAEFFDKHLRPQYFDESPASPEIPCEPANLSEEQIDLGEGEPADDGSASPASENHHR